MALDEFISGLNNLKPRLHFTSVISSSSVVFLDLVTFKGPSFMNSDLLDTEIYFKKSNTFSFIHGSSFHPTYTYKSVVIGEVLRILRACFIRDSFLSHQSSFIKQLRSLHFSRGSISAAKAIYYNQRSLSLHPVPKDNASKLFYLMKFSHLSRKVRVALHKYWLAIDSDPFLFSKFPVAPSVSFFTHPNLKSFLTHTHLNAPSSLSHLPSSTFHFVSLSPLPNSPSPCTNCYCSVYM